MHKTQLLGIRLHRVVIFSLNSVGFDEINEKRLLDYPCIRSLVYN